MTWADYKIEPKMAKTGKTAINFLHNLKQGLQSKWEAKLARFTELKREVTGDPNAVVHIWDAFY